MPRAKERRLFCVPVLRWPTSPGSWRAGGGALPSCCGPLRSLWDVTTKSRRERALRANEEVLEPLARNLLSSYLLQGREPNPEDEGGSKACEHIAQTGEQSGQQDQAIRRRIS